jgi:GNAT superfamily N-acetyltransferase
MSRIDSPDRRESAAVIVRSVTSGEIINLRHAVLRAGLPREAAFFDGDDDPGSAHFGAFDGDTLIACVTLHRVPFDAHPAWQLRGMAVAEGHQKRGVGARLLAAAEAHAAGSGYSSLLWCNARSPAVGFYARHGWQAVGEEFEIPTAGPHVRMVTDAKPKTAGRLITA